MRLNWLDERSLNLQAYGRIPGVHTAQIIWYLQNARLVLLGDKYVPNHEIQRIAASYSSNMLFH